MANKATFHGLPGKTKAETLLALSRMRNKVGALDATVITAFEATKEHVVEGHASCIGWLASTTAGTTATPRPCGGVWP